MAAGQASNFARIVLGTSNYGTDPNTTADITLQNDEYITNSTDGTIDFGAATLSTTGNFDITGDYVLENDEQIVNSTDADVEIVANDSAAALLQLFIKSSLDTPNVVDNMYMDLLYTFNNDTSTYLNYGTIRALATDVSGATEDGYIQIRTYTAGSEVVAATFGNEGVNSSGAFGAALDYIWHSDTAGDSMIWDASAEALHIIGTNGQDALNVDDGNVDIADDIDVDGACEFDKADVDDSLSVGSGVYIRKFFITAGGDSIGVIYYDSVDGAVDTAYIVE
ncbi:MAG: hypothetical protein ACFE95_13490 [Candidatus Hodarchaeota archaeon]